MERAIGKLVFFHDRVEAALRTVVAQFDISHVEGNCILKLCCLHDFARRDVEKLSLRIDEALDQPWTGDAIHFWPLTRYPLHGSASFRTLAYQARNNCQSISPRIPEMVTMIGSEILK